ncbi:MAG: N-acetylmuramoyl-L-alanine amidase [Armatimonadetes bacterium]|nr:N-acetylmuramoyl-L-alanine amidase [Armatimonadota bacterium]
MLEVIACAFAISQLQEAPYKAPGRNKVSWETSPNFGPRPVDAVIDTIVLHHTASSTLGGVVKWFATKDSQVSAHYTIGKDGSIVQHVSTFDRAWHAGNSMDIEGRTNLNNFTVGIEMVNVGDGKDPWTPEQVEAVHHLMAHLIKHRFPGIKYITSHEFIAVPLGRKSDPKGFPWDSLKDLGVKLVYDISQRKDYVKK